MLIVEVGGWDSILGLLTDAYVRISGCVRFFLNAYECLRGVWMGGLGRIPCLHNMWMTPYLLG